MRNFVCQAPVAIPTSLKVASTMIQIRRVLTIIGVVVAGLIILVRFLHSSHGLGEFVMDASECRSGRIVQKTGGILSVGGICTKDCTDDATCGDRFQCHEGACVPRGTKAFGEECEAPWDCVSFTCIQTIALPGAVMAAADGGPPVPRSYCSQSCDGLADGGTCPAGSKCRRVSETWACLRGTGGPGDPPDVDDFLRRLERARRDFESAISR